MKLINARLMMLLIFLLACAFIGLGLTIGYYLPLGECAYNACTAGLPIVPP
ncbi:MAG TPA: hypothetical protein VMV49_12075 [Candidatus Deferrimicrobium sp.]|nr:hypothetical protein [Candidatus Deferrimicrobium sp.]